MCEVYSELTIKTPTSIDDFEQMPAGSTKHRTKNSTSVNESFINPISISHYFILFTNIKLIPINSHK